MPIPNLIHYRSEKEGVQVEEADASGQPPVLWHNHLFRSGYIKAKKKKTPLAIFIYSPFFSLSPFKDMDTICLYHFVHLYICRIYHSFSCVYIP